MHCLDQVLVVAHANTIRALVKTVDEISDEDIRDLRIPNSIPLVYRLHPASLKPGLEDPPFATACLSPPTERSCPGLGAISMVIPSSHPVPHTLAPVCVYFHCAVAEADAWGFQGEYLTSWRRADTAVRAVERSQRRVLQALFRAMDKKGEGFITPAAFQKWVLATGSRSSSAKSSTSNEDQRKGSHIVASHKMTPKSLNFFKKYGLLDPDHRIDFEEFSDLSAEFWDSRDHFRMVSVEEEAEGVDEVTTSTRSDSGRSQATSAERPRAESAVSSVDQGTNNYAA